MKVVLAPDSFKECLSAHQVCDALAKGVRKAVPNAQIVARPMADGGEGTGDVLRAALNAEEFRLTVTGPLGDTAQARYWISGDGRTALIETAEANGLQLVPAERRNPLLTSTYGCGELLRTVLDRRAEHILISIGGSATVDGGKDLAAALGYRFLDADDKDLARGGGSLRELDQIIPPDDRPWEHARIEVICDVTNPLTSESGAAHVFGPQKGATPEMVEQLEFGLKRLGKLIARDAGIAVADIPGAGAAGGLGAGLAGFLDAELRSGVDIVMDLIGLDDALGDADLVITGEGKTDSQTSGGKVCAGVARRAKAKGVACVLLSGCLEGDMAPLHEIGVTSAFGLRQDGEPIEASIAAAADRLTSTAATVAATVHAEDQQH